MLTVTHSELSSKLSSVRRPGNLTSSLFAVKRAVGMFRLYSQETNLSQNHPILHTHTQTFLYYLGFLHCILRFT